LGDISSWAMPKPWWSLLYSTIVLYDIKTSVNKKLKISKGEIAEKKPRNKKGSLGWSCKPQIPILTLQPLNKIEQNMIKHYEAEILIGICGLHYHPIDPFLPCGFFQ